MKLNKTNLKKINDLVRERDEYMDYIKEYDLSPDQQILKNDPAGETPLNAKHYEDMEKAFKDFNLEYHKKIFKLMTKYIKELEDELKALGYDFGRTFDAEKYMTARILKGDIEGKPSKKADEEEIDWENLLKDNIRDRPWDQYSYPDKYQGEWTSGGSSNTTIPDYRWSQIKGTST